MAAVLMLALGSFVFAETYRGTVKKIDKDEITISYRKSKDDEPEDKKIKTTKDTTYKLRKGFKKDSETEDSDAKKFAKAHKDLPKGSVLFVTIETDDADKAKSITFLTFEGKAKKKKKKDD